MSKQSGIKKQKINNPSNWIASSLAECHFAWDDLSDDMLNQKLSILDVNGTLDIQNILNFISLRNPGVYYELDFKVR